MQNKPNFRKAKMNVSNIITMNYENFIPLAGQKNKPNSNPIKACPERSRMGQFQTGHLPVKRMKPKLLNFHRKNHRALAIGFSGLIHVNSALCLFYHFGCLRYLIQLWDLE